MHRSIVVAFWIAPELAVRWWDIWDMRLSHPRPIQRVMFGGWSHPWISHICEVLENGNIRTGSIVVFSGISKQFAPPEVLPGGLTEAWRWVEDGSTAWWWCSWRRGRKLRAAYPECASHLCVLCKYPRALLKDQTSLLSIRVEYFSVGSPSGIRKGAPSDVVAGGRNGSTWWKSRRDAGSAPYTGRLKSSFRPQGGRWTSLLRPLLDSFTEQETCQGMNWG